jgi:hypothetical protein
MGGGAFRHYSEKMKGLHLSLQRWNAVNTCSELRPPLQDTYVGRTDGA